jgi:hypothetical protein
VHLRSMMSLYVSHPHTASLHPLPILYSTPPPSTPPSNQPCTPFLHLSPPPTHLLSPPYLLSPPHLLSAHLSPPPLTSSHPFPLTPSHPSPLTSSHPHPHLLPSSSNASQVAQYHLAQPANCNLKVVGDVFWQQNFGVGINR